MMRGKSWKNLLLTIIAIFFTYSCSAAKTSNFISPTQSESLQKRPIVAKVIPTDKETPKNKETILQQLNLSPQQQQKIEKVRLQYQEEIHQKQKNLTLLQQQFSQMMTGTASARSIRLKNQELVKLRQEIGNLRFESMLATRELLTPQQRQKFRELATPQSPQEIE